MVDVKDVEAFDFKIPRAEIMRDVLAYAQPMTCEKGRELIDSGNSYFVKIEMDPDYTKSPGGRSKFHREIL